jgi:hypothetical protein
MSEPIAWTNKENLKYLQIARHANIWNQSVQKKDIPLYMHPKILELSDEEIIEEIKNIYGKEFDSVGYAEEMQLCRNVLKKASEK